MHSLTILSILSMLVSDVLTATALAPAKHSVAVRGQLMCGVIPADKVRVRLFRVKQPKKDDLNQMLAETITSKPGVFLLEGNTNGFPLNETNMEPSLSFYHTCDDDPTKVDKNGYRRFNYHIPTDYVTKGPRARKTYDLGTLNIQLEFPGEKREKKIQEKNKKT
ncbi:Transthyretin-like family protein [Dictyocaulus viviparus]|uniref:Transthyretin-like family protein n=1 Tax=Dictyocaulus viviparus TaxID=29172 RepID=A0A0D8XW62_DICVI|nr:Transthyretin-like family protein [Dictyocaulus viviparus]